MSLKLLFKNLTLVTLVLIVVVIVSNDLNSKSETHSEYIFKSANTTGDNLEKEHYEITRTYFKQREKWVTSNLGSILFKNVNPEKFHNQLAQKKTFTILVWKYWNWLENRHLNKRSKVSNVLEGCSQQNCIFIKDDALINKADAVIIHTQRGQIPKVEMRNPASRWIFLNDEAPSNLFSLSREKLTLESMAGVFNWTMTYRSDSDVPVPYGRTVPLLRPLNISLLDTETALNKLVPFWKEKSDLCMVLMSNCVPTRLKFIEALRKSLKVDIYGRCSDIGAHKIACPGSFFTDCSLSATYIFYLVLENSSCRQYLTEKIFHHAYARGAIPVIMGPPLQDCKKLLPPNSYLHISNYKTVKDLAEDMLRISKNKKEILSLHSWRRHFKAKGEHGYLETKSYHYCRVCEALNYNDAARKTYSLDDLRLLFDTKLTCDIYYHDRK